MTEQFTSRKRTRLAEYDYSTLGSYFLTICTIDHACILGHIVGGSHVTPPFTQLSEAGMVVKKHIERIGTKYPYIQLDNYVVMPNHVHILLTITAHSGSTRASTPTNAVIPRIMATFKRFVQKDLGNQIFQSSFNDHIIRDEEDFRIRWNYIENNPQRWKSDKYYKEM